MKKTKKKQSLYLAKLSLEKMAQIYGGCCNGDPQPNDPPPPPPTITTTAMYDPIAGGD